MLRGVALSLTRLLRRETAFATGLEGVLVVRQVDHTFIQLSSRIRIITEITIAYIPKLDILSDANG
jgi:hypothetical protein